MNEGLPFNGKYLQSRQFAFGAHGIILAYGNACILRVGLEKRG
jgi:hypothetical protein